MNQYPSRTWIELSESALSHNMRMIAACTGPSTIFGAVIKGDAYGHGIDMIASAVAKQNPHAWLCVAGIAEGLRVAALGNRVLSMAYYDGEIARAIRLGIRLTCATYEDCATINRIAGQSMIPAYVHIKIDTGMHRRGFFPHEIDTLTQALRERYCWLIPEGVYTHLSDPSNEDPAAIIQPCDLFMNTARRCELLLTRVMIKHMLASGALWHQEQGDMVRVGTMLYGLWKSNIQRERHIRCYPGLSLRPVLSWKTAIMEIKQVPQNSYIGYNRGYYTERSTTIAILPIGYADGYPRALSNRGTVLVGTIPAPIVGIIGMNLMTIDVTHIPTQQLDRPVTLVGPEPPVDCKTIAELLTTTPLELLARINGAIPRYMVSSPEQGELP